MKMVKKALEEIRIRYVQPYLRQLVGFQQIEEELESLRYIVEKSIDITSFPKADGLLRCVQFADIELLRIFHEICMKHNLTYWLDYGTLLGAIRHKDFIPWDDDLDVAVPRDDYNKLMQILPKEIGDYEVEFINEKERRQVLMIWKGGCMLDIFPIDSVACEYAGTEEAFRAKLRDGRKKYKHNRNKMSPEDVVLNRESAIGPSKGARLVWYHNIEFCADETYYSDEIIFPLEKASFGEYEFYVPHDSDAYLTRTYGNYMSFPKNGVLHHNGTSNKIYENPIKFNVDMDSLIETLKEIKF